MTLRELMTDSINSYWYFDATFSRNDCDMLPWKEYVNYLNLLDDEDFLSHYRQVVAAIDNLD